MSELGSSGSLQSPLLDIRDLTIRFRGGRGDAALSNVSLRLARGEGVGVLGESGAGKTTLAHSIAGLLAVNAVVAGSIRFAGKDLLAAGERELREIRGAQVSLIPQEPENTLNPIMAVGRQVEEVLKAHSLLAASNRYERTMAMLAATGLGEPGVYKAYPHQLSGGQRQRVAIARALICEPALLIADEPTSSLDNLVQADILRLLKKLRDKMQLTVLFITHNPALLAGLTERVVVFFRGRIVEDRPFEDVCRAPQHFFTRDLLHSIPC